MTIGNPIPEQEALAIVLGSVRCLPSETQALADCAGAILSEDLNALRTQPPFDASAMDGYAVRQADIQNLPAGLDVVGVSRAGEPFDGPLNSGQAVRIFTGAVVPQGADSIIIQENTETNGPDRISILQGVVPGKFIRPAGLDFCEGETLLNAGDLLTANRIALAASMNHAHLPVYSRPHVALMATGDELVLPGDALEAGQIIASNTFGLAAGLSQSGCAVSDFGIVQDKEQSLRSAFSRAMEKGCDVIVTTGGASVGDHDLILPVARSLGFDIRITKIAMRPGKPFIFGTLDRVDKRIYLTGLAGNPVSSLVAFTVFVKPLIAALKGKSQEQVVRIKAILGRDLPQNDERAEYMRGILSTGSEGEAIATPFERQDSSMLARLVQANCLIYRPVSAPAAQKGDPCEYLPIE